MMQEAKKLYAEFTWDNYRNDNDQPERREIKTLDDAVLYGLQKNATFFRTFEIETVEMGGKVFTGDPSNFSGRQFLNADRLYTPADVVKETKQSLGSPELGTLAAKLERNGLKQQADELRRAISQPHPIVKQAEGDLAETRYVRQPFSGFTRLETGDAAFDSTGIKVWPSVSMPAPVNAGPKIPKPSDKFKLK